MSNGISGMGDPAVTHHISRRSSLLEASKVLRQACDRPVILYFLAYLLSMLNSGTLFASSPAIAAGQYHTVALMSDGSLLAWGSNSNGQLGDGTLNDSSVPMQIGTGYSAISAGDRHTVALRPDGSVWTWGWNQYGQLGNGTTTDGLVPEKVAMGFNTISAGAEHTVALKPDGSLWTWGLNFSGQLGDGTTTDSLLPKPVGTGFSAIAGGFRHTVALKSDGSLWAWGNNWFGQLGDATITDSLVPKRIGAGYAAIAAGQFSTIALKSDGSLWAWGSNQYGQLGDGTTVDSNIPKQIGTGYRAIAAGGDRGSGKADFYLAVKSDGSLWAWGNNWFGQLGDGTTADSNVPKRIGANYLAIAGGGWHTVALTLDGTLSVWGWNNFGQFGDGTLVVQRTVPVLVVNGTVDGYLNLISGSSYQAPPGVGVPFFVVASGYISETGASVSTTTKFNKNDLGKTGSVFVTAAVPPGSLVPVVSGMTALGSSGVGGSGASDASRMTSSAATAADSCVQVQLTTQGWKPLVNGQLIPYAIGVLGDQLSGQTILNNTDTTNLKGAQFCVGYGTGADQMIAAGTMRVVATIPEPNGTCTASCIVTGAAVSYSLRMPQGWSLVGNGLNQTLTVASLYNDVNSVTSVWKWDAGTTSWQFYTPAMDAATLQIYASSKGYGVLTTINPGEGYWVNSKAQPTIGTQSGASFILTSPNLAEGWNLVATGNDIAPTQFNTNLKSSLPGTGVTTLWAWDNSLSTWYFYAPSLEAQGGTALSNYIQSKGYLDFTAASKTLGNGTGFWVNR